MGHSLCCTCRKKSDLSSPSVIPLRRKEREIVCRGRLERALAPLLDGGAFTAAAERSLDTGSHLDYSTGN
jgi:hypothetical protein